MPQNKSFSSVQLLWDDRLFIVHIHQPISALVTSSLSKQKPIEGNFSKVSFLDQVETSETFTVESHLEIISGLPVKKEVIVFALHIVAMSFKYCCYEFQMFCFFTMAFRSLNPHVT